MGARRGENNTSDAAQLPRPATSVRPRFDFKAERRKDGKILTRGLEWPWPWSWPAAISYYKGSRYISSNDSYARSVRQDKENSSGSRSFNFDMMMPEPVLPSARVMIRWRETMRQRQQKKAWKRCGSELAMNHASLPWKDDFKVFFEQGSCYRAGDHGDQGDHRWSRWSLVIGVITCSI